jgi:hypothetical protein
VRFSTPSGIEGRTTLPGPGRDAGSGRSTAPEGAVSAVGSGASTRPGARFLRAGPWLGSSLGVEFDGWLVEFDGALRGPLLPVSATGCVGCGCRGSRPRKTRERLRSSSSVTPGARSAAPVGRSKTSGRRRPRTPDASPSGEGAFPINVTGRRGKLSTTGSASTTRLATGSSAIGRPIEPLPKSLRGTRVTPRQFL